MYISSSSPLSSAFCEWTELRVSVCGCSERLWENSKPLTSRSLLVSHWCLCRSHLREKYLSQNHGAPTSPFVSKELPIHSLFERPGGFFLQNGLCVIETFGVKYENSDVWAHEVQYGRWQTQPLAVLDLEHLSGPFKLQTFHAFGVSRWFFCPAKAQRQIASNFQYFFCWDEKREILFSVPEY